MDSNSPSEKELLNACIQGSKEAWDAFVDKYTKLIYHTINRTLRSHYGDHLYQDSSDIHNSVFLSLVKDDYRKLRQYKGKNGCKVSTWLMVVTRHFTLNYIKKQKQHIPIEDDTTDNVDVIEKVSDPQQQPDEELSKKESEEILKELVKDLNANDRLFLKLYYEQELPPEEIAEILGLTVSAVYSKKNRIIEKLKKILKKRKKLKDLNSDEKQVFELMFVENLSPEETAKKLGLKVGTVYSIKNRIIEKLK